MQLEKNSLIFEPNMLLPIVLVIIMKRYVPGFTDKLPCFLKVRFVTIEINVAGLSH